MNRNEGAAVRFLLVEAGGIPYLLPLPRVIRVLAGLRLHPCPGASPVVAGLAEVGGEPLLVLAVEQFASSGHEVPASAAVTVVAQVGPPDALETVGLQVEAALDIVEVKPEAISRVRAGVVCGEAMVQGRAARVLDLEEIGRGE